MPQYCHDLNLRLRNVAIKSKIYARILEEAKCVEVQQYKVGLPTVAFIILHKTFSRGAHSGARNVKPGRSTVDSAIISISARSDMTA
jgi:hypothetical protein